MRFHRRGGRKPHRHSGRDRNRATLEAQPDGTLVKALARAWRWQRMLDDGAYTSFSEIGDAENMLAATQNQIEADLPGAVLGLERVIQTERRGLARAKGTGCATLKFCYSWRIVNEWLMKLDR
jgi:hypothetical protein